MKILFINACVRERSRTRWLAEYLLSKFKGEVTQIDLAEEGIMPLDEKLLAKRDALFVAGNLDDPMMKYARQFAAADLIVIAAPYWDLSFPALLKTYIEAVCVGGVTFMYGEDGRPQGLCKADKVYYVTTAGGPVFDDAFGFGYIRAVCSGLFGIKDVCQFKAEGLDIIGADIYGILKKAKQEIDEVTS